MVTPEIYTSTDGTTVFYYRTSFASSPAPGLNLIEYANNIGRVGLRFDSGASAIGVSAKIVQVQCMKWGDPSGNVSVVAKE